jgi:hypothetical protein
MSPMGNFSTLPGNSMQNTQFKCTKRDRQSTLDPWTLELYMIELTTSLNSGYDERLTSFRTRIF